MTGMHECEECHAEYPSKWAAEECADDDREQDRRNRQNYRGGRHAAEHQ